MFKENRLKIKQYKRRIIYTEWYIELSGCMFNVHSIRCPFFKFFVNCGLFVSPNSILSINSGNNLPLFSLQAHFIWLTRCFPTSKKKYFGLTVVEIFFMSQHLNIHISPIYLLLSLVYVEVIFIWKKKYNVVFAKNHGRARMSDSKIYWINL